jgi:ubiquitin-protein ligase
MSHCFEKRLNKEIEDLSQDCSISISYDITSKEKEFYKKILKNTIAKIIIPIKEYDIILYFGEDYPFRAPHAILRKMKTELLKDYFINENIIQSILHFLGDEQYEYYSIQSFVIYQMNLLCQNQDEKKIFLDWKYKFDANLINHYAPSIHLREMVSMICHLIEIILSKKQN